MVLKTPKESPISGQAYFRNTIDMLKALEKAFIQIQQRNNYEKDKAARNSIDKLTYFCIFAFENLLKANYHERDLVLTIELPNLVTETPHVLFRHTMHTDTRFPDTKITELAVECIAKYIMGVCYLYKNSILLNDEGLNFEKAYVQTIKENQAFQKTGKYAVGNTPREREFESMCKLLKTFAQINSFNENTPIVFENE